MRKRARKKPVSMRATYDAVETAAILGISVKTLYQLVQQERFPVPKIKGMGDRVLFAKAGIDPLVGRGR